MFGRFARIIAISLATELAGALLTAGRRWVDRKLDPAVVPQERPPSSPDSSEGRV